MIFLDTSSAIEILKGNHSLENHIEKFNSKSFAITSPLRKIWTNVDI